MEEKNKNISVGDILIGTVSKVRPYAAFLSFEEGVNGLLHISEINGGFIRDIEKYVSIGDEIKVKVIDIDATNGFLRVSIKDLPEEERYSTHINREKVSVIAKDDEFETIKESLPKWIENTLKEAEENEK